MPDDSGLRRFDEYVGMVALGQMWHLSRRADRLACALTTHPLGWELRTTRNDALTRSQVCKAEADVFATAAAWRAEALAHGWME